MTEKSRATLFDRHGSGGVNGGKGYGFQADYIVSRIPTWLADREFAAFLQEGAGDVDVLFKRADGDERWYVQVKNYPVTPAKARKVFAAFLKTNRGSPGTYTHFTLACPGLNDDLRRLRSAVEELRGAAPLFESGQHEILDNMRADLEGLVESLDLPVDAQFLLDKVHFDTNLAGLTDASSLRQLFVGGLVERGDWKHVAPAGLFRAYEKLALLCHQAEALRQTYSRQDVEAKIREAVDEVPTTPDEFFAGTPKWNPDFVGREEDLARLHQALTGEGPGPGERGRAAVAGPVALTGTGGSGKTEMAVEYVHRHRDEYPGGVFWINAAEPLAPQFAKYGRQVNAKTVERSREEQIRAIVSHLRQHPKALLLLDNVADPNSLSRPVIADLVLAELTCRVLFTTRQRDVGHFASIEVTPLPLPDIWVLVAGTGWRKGVPPEHGFGKLRQTSEELGRILAKGNFGLITGGWPGVDEMVTRAFEDELQDLNLPLTGRLKQVITKNAAYAAGEYRKVAKSDREEWGETEKAIKEDADAVVLLGGRSNPLWEGGTYKTFKLALKTGKPVFPLADTGDVAMKIYLEMVDHVKAGYFDQIDHKTFSRVAESAPGVVERLVTLLKMI